MLWGICLTVPLTKHVGGNIPGTRLHARWNGVTTLWSTGIHSEPSLNAVAFVSTVYISWRLKRPQLTVDTQAYSISNELWTVWQAAASLILLFCRMWLVGRYIGMHKHFIGTVSIQKVEGACTSELLVAIYWWYVNTFQNTVVLMSVAQPMRQCPTEEGVKYQPELYWRPYVCGLEYWKKGNSIRTGCWGRYIGKESGNNRRLKQTWMSHSMICTAHKIVW